MRVVVLALSLVLLGCAQKPRIPQPEGVLVLPLYHLGSAHRFVRAEVNGRGWLFLIDTGAAESAVTPRAAEEMGLVIQLGGGELNGIGGETEAASSKIPSLTLGSLVVRRLPVRVVSISTPFVQQQPDLVAGYLGSSFFQNFQLGLDLAGGELRLARPGGAPLFSGTPTRIPLRKIQGETRLLAEIDGDHIDLEVDTGADRLVLFRKETRLRGEPLELYLGGVGPGAILSAELVRTKSMRIGDLELGSVVAIIVDKERQKGGLLGADLLSRFLVELDPTRPELLLWPRPPAEGAIDARAPAPKPEPGPAVLIEGGAEIEIR